MLYLTVLRAGGTFTSFQWDILLLEAGFAAIWLAPVLPCSRSTTPPGPLLLLRWLLFKLMLMSGAVKAASGCPAWLGLTACHYHFATQCLPTPVAWWLHQLPGPLLKAAVGATLLLELPATFLILAPSRRLRLAAAGLQSFLQVLIITSGNYTFFNLLTLLLCIPLLDVATLPSLAGIRGRTPAAPSPRSDAADATLEEAAGTARGRRFRQLGALDAVKNIAGRLALPVASGALLMSSAFMFRVSIDFHLVFGPPELQACLSTLMPPVALAWGSAIGLSGTANVARAATQRGRRPLVRLLGATWGLVVLGATCGLFLLSTMNFFTLHPPLLAPFQRRASAIDLYHAAQPWRLTSGYGLFRRMTGVGDVQALGLATERPEVEVQGSDDGSTWLPYVFKYKPGPLDRPPPWVAPHQPRLDWQMWFAALGTYQGHSWFVHLVYKILVGEPSVLALLDGVPAPFRERPPRLVRAQLYKYDMTRPAWGRHRQAPGGGPMPSLGDSNGSLWWTRTLVGEYFPAIGRDNPSLHQFLRQRGWGPDIKQEPDGDSPIIPLIHLARRFAEEVVAVFFFAIGLALVIPTLVRRRSDGATASAVKHKEL